VFEDGASLVLAVAAALALGARHAMDPDHIAAVATLTGGEGGPTPRAARTLGLAWGLGHALTLVGFGFPLVLAGIRLPHRAEQAAETAVAVLVILLALRLLRRWRRGRFHIHAHSHPGGVRHVHPHAHADSREHSHAHTTRTPAGAFAIGLVHGLGGSGGAGLLVLASASSPPVATAALLLFALGAAAAMSALTSGFGLALAREPVLRRLHTVAPALALATAGFGAWYGLAVFGVVPAPA
jgi:ABC-type nickel/cobalt efflux system permease component RcnA